jgi:hypothetical protein
MFEERLMGVELRNTALVWGEVSRRKEWKDRHKRNVISCAIFTVVGPSETE